jgi:hypothetical protein
MGSFCLISYYGGDSLARAWPRAPANPANPLQQADTVDTVLDCVSNGSLIGVVVAGGYILAATTPVGWFASAGLGLWGGVGVFLTGTVTAQRIKNTR